MVDVSPACVRRVNIDVDGQLLERGSGFEDVNYCTKITGAPGFTGDVELKIDFRMDSEVSEARKGGKIDQIRGFCLEQFSTRVQCYAKRDDNSRGVPSR